MELASAIVAIVVVALLITMVVSGLCFESAVVSYISGILAVVLMYGYIFIVWCLTRGG